MALAFLAQLGIAAGLWLLSRYLAPKPEDPRALKFGDLGVPKIDEGVPVALFWGRVRVHSPGVVFTGGYSADPFELSFLYRLTMQFVLGLPGRNFATLRRMWVGDVAVWEGNVAAPDPPASVNWYDDVGNPLLSGWLAYMPGSFTQTWSAEAIEAFEHSGVDTTLIPNYRGQATVLLYGDDGNVTGEGRKMIGFFHGMEPRLDAYSFEVQAQTATTEFGATFALIGDGDANPANIIYDVLTEEWGRLGFDDADLDLTSFLNAATTLKDEYHGMSLVVPAGTEAREILQEVVNQVDGVLFQAPDTGKVTFKLIREDYVVANLPLFNPDNTLELVSFTTTTFEQTYNQVRVVYTSRAKEYKERVAVAQNGAAIEASGGKVRSIEYRFPGITTANVAAQVAARELRIAGLPLAKMKITVNRDGYKLRPGDPIKFTWPEYGISEMVFRVQKYDLGDLHNGRIVLDCIQDHFAFEHTVLDDDDWEVFPDAPPDPSSERLVTEAPRWFQYRAVELGILSAVGPQRSFALAIPKGTASFYRSKSSIDAGTTYEADAPAVNFPGRAKVETAYARTLDPYDTGTGLRIKDLAGITLASATATQIKNEGRNLFMVVTAAGVVEILSYESATDLGGGVWRLNNVSRGLLDTVPRALAVDERIYFLGAGAAVGLLDGLGQRGYDYNAVAKTGLVVTSGAGSLDPTDPEIDQFLDSMTIGLRNKKPLPVADLTLNASKSPAQLEEEGVDLAWKRRDRLSDVIVRGDAASETVEGGTTYTVRGAMTGAAGVDLVTGETGSSKDDVHLGRAGYGPIAVSVRSQRTHTLPDGSTVPLASHQDPELEITAPEWRNLLLNPRFAGGALTHWTTVQGSPQAVTPGIGGAGYYVTGEDHVSGNCELTQTQRIDGYIPKRLRAELDVLARNVNSDADDTLTLELIALDASDAVLSTTTYGPTAQSTTVWNRRTANNANLPAGTAKVRARALLAGVGETKPDTAITELRLRVGQFTDQLLTNPDFETGTLVGWTAITGTFTVETTGQLYLGANYAKGDAAADSSQYQEYLLSGVPGYEIGADLVLEFARMNDNANGLGQVTVELRDASGVLSTLATANENVGSTWVRKRLSGAIPAGCDRVRVILSSTRQASTASACFDDFDLRCHKHLDADTDYEVKLDAPVKQYQPASVLLWEYHYPTVPAPDLGFWPGDSLQGVLGTEPDMEATAGTVTTGSKYTGPYDGDVVAHDALLFDGIAHLQTEGNVTFGNFTTAGQGFTIVADLKSQEEAATVAREICSRLGTTGWTLATLATGELRATLDGASAVITATSAASVIDACPHRVAMIYDPAASQLHVVVDGTVVTASTAGMGEIRCDELERFTFGDDWKGQLRLHVWRKALTTAQVTALMTHGDAPSAELLHARTGVLAAVVGEDVSGVVVSRFSGSQVAFGWHTGSDLWGLVLCPSMTNLIPTNDLTDTAKWVRGASAVVVTGVTGPEGLPTALRITGDSAAAKAVDATPVPLGTSVTCRVVWFARRQSGSGAARVSLVNTSDVVKGTHDFTPTSTWAMYTHLFTTWDDSTPDAKIRFAASDSATSKGLEICGPFYVSQTVQVPAAIPIGGSAVSFSQLQLDESMPAQWNHEGEIVVTGICPEASPNAVAYVFVASNGADNRDARWLRMSATSQAEFLHFDGAAAQITSETTAQTWDTLWTVRGRWCRAGLIETASAFAGVVFGSDDNDPADYDRVAIWNAGAAVMGALRIGGVGVNTPVHALIRFIRLVARESRLPAG